MRTISPGCLDPHPADRSVAVDLRVREQPDEEEDEEEDEEDNREEEDDDYQEDDGYSE